MFPEPENHSSQSTGKDLANGRLAKLRRWDDTALGAVEAWPPPLKSTVNFLLNSRFPMFLFWGPDLYFFYNDAWHEIFNLEGSSGPVIGEPAEKVLGGFWNTIQPIITKVRSGDERTVGVNHTIPVNVSDKDTVSSWALSFCPVFGAGGVVDGVLATVNEYNNSDLLSQKAKLESDFEESMSKLNSIIQWSNDAIMTLSPDGTITGWNRSAERIFGFTASEITGKSVSQLLPPDKWKEKENISAIIKKGESVHNLATQRLTRDKGTIDILLSASPLFSLAGKVIGVTTIMRDITSQKRNEQLIIENEERLQLVLSASELGTWEHNLVTNEIRYSKKYLEILGYKEHRAFTHEQLLEHIHPADVQLRQNAMKKAMVSGLLNYEFRLTRSDGVLCWVEARGQVFYDEEKKPVKLIGTFRDITERRTRVEELRESEQKFRILADSVPQLTWTGDANGNLNYFNLALFEYAGLTPKQIHKDGWIQIVHPDDRLESVKLWAKAIDEGEPFLTEHRFKRYDGQYRWYLSRALPQKDSKGVTQMWVGTSTDVHDQKVFSEELEKNVELRTVELKKAIEELVKTNRELEQFAYVSSHDLQEPLRKIQTFSGILQDKLGTNPELKIYLNKINTSAQRMSDLIKDLLNYSRLSKTEALYVETDLNEILERVRNDFEVLMQQKKAIIISTRLPLIKAIPIQMNQLIYNLVGNSLKFSDKKPFIEISAKEATAYTIRNNPSLNPGVKYHHLTFKDNGIGFSPEYSEQIFTIFQRLNDLHKYSGTGIGLAMCKKIVENHNGFINAESEPGKGATFNVFLPYQ